MAFAPAPNGSISVGTGLDGNQAAMADSGDANALYTSMKQQANTANKRYAAAWRMIPSDIRSELQQSISALPKQVDAKCKRLAKQYMTSNDDMERRAIYLKCSMDHENVLSEGIERYARDYRNGSAGDFLDYTHAREPGVPQLGLPVTSDSIKKKRAARDSVALFFCEWFGNSHQKLTTLSHQL